MNYQGIIISLMGLFSIICAIGNWNFFMENRKARIFVKLFTRNGARIFYIILGLIISILGVLISIGKIN